MSAITQDEDIIWGRSAALTVTVGNLGASGLNAYNDVRFTAKRDVSDADSAAIISKTLASGIAITTAGDATTNGVLTVTLAPTDTTALPAGYAVALAYDVSVYDVSGHAYSVAGGVLTVTPTATQATS